MYTFFFTVIVSFIMSMTGRVATSLPAGAVFSVVAFVPFEVALASLQLCQIVSSLQIFLLLHFFSSSARLQLLVAAPPLVSVTEHLGWFSDVIHELAKLTWITVSRICSALFARINCSLHVYSYGYSRINDKTVINCVLSGCARQVSLINLS